MVIVQRLVAGQLPERHDDYYCMMLRNLVLTLLCRLSWYVEYHLQGFAVKSVVTSSCNCIFIQSTSILGFSSFVCLVD